MPASRQHAEEAWLRSGLIADVLLPQVSEEIRRLGPALASRMGGLSFLRNARADPERAAAMVGYLWVRLALAERTEPGEVDGEFLDALQEMAGVDGPGDGPVGFANPTQAAEILARIERDVEQLIPGIVEHIRSGCVQGCPGPEAYEWIDENSHPVEDANRLAVLLTMVAGQRDTQR